MQVLKKVGRPIARRVRNILLIGGVCAIAWFLTLMVMEWLGW